MCVLKTTDPLEALHAGPRMDCASLGLSCCSDGFSPEGLTWFQFLAEHDVVFIKPQLYHIFEELVRYETYLNHG